MNPWIAIAGVGVVMVAGVVVTMVVENWRCLRQPVPAPAPGTDDHEPRSWWEDDVVDDRVVEVVPLAGPPSPTEPTSVQPRPADGHAPPADHDRPGGSRDLDGAEPALTSTPTFEVPSAGRPERALSVSGRSVRLRDPATVDVLTALLFAAVAASRRSGADRAAAWVTAVDTPPGEDPARFPANVRLRGKPSKVAALLAHREGGATWVCLQPGVDIARGLSRSPVTQPTLAGLVTWWQRTRELPTVLDAATAAAVAESIGSVRPQLDETPWSDVVGRLHDALADAADAGEPLLVASAGPGGSIDDPDPIATTGDEPARAAIAGPTPAAQQS